MQIHGITSLHGAQPLQGPHRMQPAEATRPTEAWYGVDEVEISQEAAFVSQTHDLPDIRADRVAEIRAQVADGVYETEAKLDIALGRFLDEVAG